MVESQGKCFCNLCANEVTTKTQPNISPPETLAEKLPAVSSSPVNVNDNIIYSALPVASRPPIAEKPVAAPFEVTEIVPKAPEKIASIWWLMPVFLVWVGGLASWALNKDKDSKRAKSMLIWGIAFTFIWLIVLTLIGLIRNLIYLLPIFNIWQMH